MNVEIGAEAAQFPEKEYINGIVFAVQGCRAGMTLAVPERLGINIPLFFRIGETDSNFLKRTKNFGSKHIKTLTDNGPT